MKQRWSLAEVTTAEHVGLSRSERVMAWGSVPPMRWLRATRITSPLTVDGKVRR